jgi:hypothetical protein
MLSQAKNTAKRFTTARFETLFDRDMNNANIEATIELAASDPVKLYYFMQRYAYFNSYAGSLVARLASSIGISYQLFRQDGIKVIDQSDRGLEIAAKVLAATIDEHADAGAQHLPHRTLAQVTLQAIGEYAELTPYELNQVAQAPIWMHMIIVDLINGYQGKIDNLEAIVKALGFHIGSELLADQEYSLIDKVIRHTNRGIGFDAWLQGKQVNVGGKRLSPWYWVVVHGKYNSSGVEAEHFELALDALNLVAEYRPESNEQIWSWAVQGFLSFAELQQRLFNCTKAELMAIDSAEPAKSGLLSSALSDAMGDTFSDALSGALSGALI